MRDKSEESEVTRLKLRDLSVNKADLESKLRHQEKFEKIRWEEFDKMADEMKQFSRNMSPIRRSISSSPVKNRSLEID